MKNQQRWKGPSYLQQFEGGQQLPSSAVPSVHLVVLQLGGEPGGAVVLVAHLHRGLGERPAYELRLPLGEAAWRQADQAVEVGGTKEWGGGV